MEAMTTRTSVSRASLGRLAIAGGAVLVVQAVAAAATKQNTHYAASTGDALSDVLLGAGLLLALACVEALRRILSPRVGGLAVAGQAALVVSIAATIAAGHEVLDAVYIAGTVAWFAGLVAIAVGAWRSGDRGWWPAIPLPLAALVALALADAGGAVLLGLAFVVLGARALRTSSAWPPRIGCT